MWNEHLNQLSGYLLWSYSSILSEHCNFSQSSVGSFNLLHPSNFICRRALLWPVPRVQTLTPDEVTPSTRCKLYLVNTPLSSSPLQLLQLFRVLQKLLTALHDPADFTDITLQLQHSLQCLVSSLDIYDTEWSRCILNTGVTLQKWGALCTCLNNEVQV